MCECIPRFGGPDCTIDILEPPEFFLSQTCCDVRKYKCHKISGYGYPLARKTKLYYKIIYSEVYYVFIIIIGYSYFHLPFTIQD